MQPEVVQFDSVQQAALDGRLGDLVFWNHIALVQAHHRGHLGSAARTTYSIRPEQSVSHLISLLVARGTH